MSDEPVLRVEKSDGIATITLNRPRAMNALSLALRRAVREAFETLPEDPSIGVVILTGAGDRAFSAGLDLKELGGEVKSGESTEQAVSGGDNLIRAMAECPLPIIGAINGLAITGGFELALACDVLVASTNARFADTHARVGILPGWGLSQKLPRLIGILRAKELSLTGNFLSAEQAERWGLVNRVVAPEALLPSCRQLATDMMSCEPGTMRAYKRLIDQGYAESLGDGLRRETKASVAHVKSVSPDAIAERRKAIQARGRAQQG